MIEQAWNFISHQLATNQFFSCAALTGVLMSVLYTLKPLPMQIWSRVHRHIVFKAFVEEEDTLCSSLDIYIHQKYPKKLKNVEVITVKDEMSMSHDNDYIHIWYKGRRILISKHREKLENASNPSNRYVRSYNVSGIWAKKAIQSLILEVMAFAKKYREEEKSRRKKIDTYVLDYSE